VKFMNWIKANNGKTLADAIEAWKQIKKNQKENTQPKKIAPQFEYNTYLRDFCLDNPELKRSVGIQLWNIKKTLRGTNAYSKADLKLLKSK